MASHWIKNADIVKAAAISASRRNYFHANNSFNEVKVVHKSISICKNGERVVSLLLSDGRKLKHRISIG